MYSLFIVFPPPKQRLWTQSMEKQDARPECKQSPWQDILRQSTAFASSIHSRTILLRFSLLWGWIFLTNGHTCCDIWIVWLQQWIIWPQLLKHTRVEDLIWLQSEQNIYLRHWGTFVPLPWTNKSKSFYHWFILRLYPQFNWLAWMCFFTINKIHLELRWRWHTLLSLLFSEKNTSLLIICHPEWADLETGHMIAEEPREEVVKPIYLINYWVWRG